MKSSSGKKKKRRPGDEQETNDVSLASSDDSAITRPRTGLLTRINSDLVPPGNRPSPRLQPNAADHQGTQILPLTAWDHLFQPRQIHPPRPNNPERHFPAGQLQAGRDLSGTTFFHQARRPPGPYQLPSSGVRAPVPPYSAGAPRLNPRLNQPSSFASVPSWLHTPAYSTTDPDPAHPYFNSLPGRPVGQTPSLQGSVSHSAGLQIIGNAASDPPPTASPQQAPEAGPTNQG